MDVRLNGMAEEQRSEDATPVNGPTPRTASPVTSGGDPHVTSLRPIGMDWCIPHGVGRCKVTSPHGSQGVDVAADDSSANLRDGLDALIQPPTKTLGLFLPGPSHSFFEEVTLIGESYLSYREVAQRIFDFYEGRLGETEKGKDARGFADGNRPGDHSATRRDLMRGMAFVNRLEPCPNRRWTYKLWLGRIEWQWFMRAGLDSCKLIIAYETDEDSCEVALPWSTPFVDDTSPLHVYFQWDRYGKLGYKIEKLETSQAVTYRDLIHFIYGFYHVTPLTAADRDAIAQTSDIWGYAKLAASERENVMRADVMGDCQFVDGIAPVEGKPRGHYRVMLGS